MKACPRSDEFMWYPFNGISILGVEFATLVTLSRHLYGRHDWRPLFLVWIFKRDLTIIAYAKFDEFLIVGYFKSFRCYCHSVGYSTMPMINEKERFRISL